MSQTYADRQSIATPLYFNPKENSLLPLKLKGVASILKPEFVQFSPCLGASLTTSPLIANLLRISPLSGNRSNISDAVMLTHSLFFQMIRESCIFLCRTKSMPAAYLSPKLIGGIVGKSLSHCDEKIIASYLKKEYGIQSNKINGNQWTGVSFTRWLDLFRFTSSGENQQRWLTLAVWLTALWESAESKLDWLEFLLECDKQLLLHKKESIFRQDQFVQALTKKDPTAIEEWLGSEFSPEDLSISNVQTSLDRLIFYHSAKPFNNEDEWLDISRAFELVGTATALRQLPLSGQSKKVVSNGYYGFDGGNAKADCTEATVREIINLLLWDQEKSSFDVSRLPPSASPALINFYQNLSGKQDVGQDWFDLMSDLPSCEYFARGSDNSQPYELAPTISNISQVSNQLLFGGKRDNLKSLHDLSLVWSAHSLKTRTQKLIHKTNTDKSGDAVALHEFATLQLEGDSIEIRMRCVESQKTGFCAVTHMRQSTKYFTDDQIRMLRRHCIVPSAGSGRNPSALRILALALTPDIGLLQNPKREAFINQERERSTTAIILDLMSTAFGCERRGIVANSDGNSIAQEDFNHRELKTSRALLRLALYRICNLHKCDPIMCLILLKWILQESPVVVESPSTLLSDELSSDFDEELEMMIIALPKETLGKISTSLYNNDWTGLIRGKVLAACASVISGESSLVDIFFSDDLSLSEKFAVMSKLYSLSS